MSIVVFGGSGFLGSFVADLLSDAGHDVTIYDLKWSPYLRENQRMIVGDILDRHKVSATVKGAEVVYNFAGVSDIRTAKDDPYNTLHTNVVGNLNLLDACVNQKVKRFIFASTLYVYSKSGSFYRASKQASELVIESFSECYGLKYTILRYGSLYGPRANHSNWIHRILNQAIREGRIIREGDGEEIREYIHVQDAARLSIKAMGSEFENQYVVISGNQSIKIKDLMMMIKEMFGNTIELEFLGTTNDVHYEITPYNFRPKLAKRIEDSSFIDLGQGILDLIYSISEEKREGDREAVRTLRTPGS